MDGEVVVTTVEITRETVGTVVVRHPAAWPDAMVGEAVTEQLAGLSERASYWNGAVRVVSAVVRIGEDPRENGSDGTPLGPDPIELREPGGAPPVVTVEGA